MNEMCHKRKEKQQEHERRMSSLIDLDLVKQIYQRGNSKRNHFPLQLKLIKEMQKMRLTYEHGTGKVVSMSTKHNICYIYDYFHSLAMLRKTFLPLLFSDYGHVMTDKSIEYQ